MSLFGSMTTAISGMNAQSAALGHISDNVANSQTVGFKRVDTTFSDLLTQSTNMIHMPGAVVTKPDATVNLQGSVEMVENPLSMALGGNGMFSVAQQSGVNEDGTPVFSDQNLFSRAGDFKKQAGGFLVNGAGYALQGWTANANGALDKSTLKPIQVSESPMAAVASTKISLAASLPKVESEDTTSFSSQAQVYDASGTARPLQLNWTRVNATDWSLAVAGEGGTMAPTTVSFDTAGALTSPSTLPVGMADGSTVSLDLSGLTQSGSTYEQTSITVDGSRKGEFRSVAIRDSGEVVVSYDNGKSKTVAQVPVVTFTNPDALQRMDGQAFGMTAEAGTMQVQAAGDKGAGTIAASAVERSNVDIAAEFSKLIVAQRAYTANTRIVTASDEMLNETINMRR